MNTYLEQGFLIVETDTPQEAQELRLLCFSRNLPFTFQYLQQQAFLIVPPEATFIALQEIDAYLSENRDWPSKHSQADQQQTGSSAVALHVIVLSLLLTFHGTIFSSLQLETWFKQGRFSAEAVLQGDWQRTFTALTLHLDDAHLLSNCCALLLFVAGITQLTGPGLAWLLVLLSGATGNFLNAVMYQTGHYSVGASTAVFGAVGILGSLQIRRFYTPETKSRLAVPVIGGLAIFAIFGSNPDTDVLAHFFGFLAGLVIGLIVLPLLRPSVVEHKWIQAGCLVVAASLLFQAWYHQLFFVSGIP